MTYADFKEEWSNREEHINAYSSGSTGQPKHIRLLKSDMMVSAKRTNEFFGIDKDSVLAIPLSADYIAGKMMWVRAWMANCILKELEVSNRFDFDGAATLLAIVPSQIPWLMQHPEWAKGTSNIIIGGAPMRKEDGDGLLDVGYNNVYCTYGMTETMSHVALRKIEKGKDNPYLAMDGIEFDVDDRGCLIIYQSSCSIPKIITNDVVELISPCAFIWKGRWDNVINSGGIKIHPEKLEAEIANFIEGSDFYVIGDDDEKWGTVPVLVFEGDEGKEEEIMKKLRENLDHRFIPKKIMARPSLLRTSSGKIIRKKPSDF